jgi:hypothetical protein
LPEVTERTGANCTALDKTLDAGPQSDTPADTPADIARDSLPVHFNRNRHPRPASVLLSDSTVGKESIVSEQAYEAQPNHDMMHSLITRVWLEEDGWRGYLINVDSGQRHYVKSTAEIMSHYLYWLQTLGVRPTVRERFIRWISRF